MERYKCAWVWVSGGWGGFERGSYSKRALKCGPTQLSPKRISVISHAGGRPQKRSPMPQSAVRAQAQLPCLPCLPACMFTQNDIHQHFPQGGGWWSAKLSVCMRLNGYRMDFLVGGGGVGK